MLLVEETWFLSRACD